MSPIFTASLAVQKSLVTIANQLGLSIASRKRLQLTFKKEDENQTSIFDFADSIDIDDDLEDI